MEASVLSHRLEKDKKIILVVGIKTMRTFRSQKAKQEHKNFPLEMNATMWKILERLPTELLGSIVFTMLELRDCVWLESAVVNKRDRLVLAQAVPFRAPLGHTEEVKDSDTAKLTWLKDRSVSGLRFLVHSSLDARKIFAKHSSMIQTVTVTVDSVDSDQSIVADVAKDQLMAPLLSILIFTRPISGDILRELPTQLRNLRHLEWVYRTDTESWCAHLLKNNPHIRTLRITGIWKELTAELAEAIVRAWQLDELAMGFRKSFDAEASLNEALASIAAAASACSTTLSIRKFVALAREQDWLGGGLIKLVQCCPLLQELTLPKGVYVYSSDSVALVTACRNLRTLDCTSISLSNALLNALEAANPPLESLSMKWDVTSVGAVDGATQLLSRLLKIDVFLICTAASLQANMLKRALGQAASLRDLTLTCPADVAHCVAQSTHALCKLVVTRSLAEVSMDVNFCTIAQRSPRLIELRVHGELRLSDMFLQALAAHCPGLEIVQLDRATTFTDAGVVALAESCAYLKTVLFHSARLLTDASVLALAKGCPRLTSFACYSPLLTEAALVQLIHRCRRLRLLSTSAQSMTHAMKQDLGLRRAGLRIDLHP